MPPVLGGRISNLRSIWGGGGGSFQPPHHGPQPTQYSLSHHTCSKVLGKGAGLPGMLCLSFLAAQLAIQTPS